jgi:MraZ protein
MDQAPNPGKTIDAPRGIFPARVDEKGRLKLPSPFQQYLYALGEQKVFITTLDERTARIYPISVWKENENFFDQFADDPAAAEDVAFVANDWGADSELDSQGRLLVPQELRRALGIENQPVWLHCYKGRINVYSKQVYEERKSRASQGLAEKVQLLEKRGLK